jgi:hypothetical protein
VENRQAHHRHQLLRQSVLPQSRPGGRRGDGRFLLSWYGYDAGAKAQSASALNGIVLLFSVIPGVGYLITAGVVRLLKVDRTLMRQIQSDLEKRRSNYSELNEYQELKTSEHVRKA